MWCWLKLSLSTHHTQPCAHKCATLYSRHIIPAGMPCQCCKVQPYTIYSTFIRQPYFLESLWFLVYTGIHQCLPGWIKKSCWVANSTNNASQIMSSHWQYKFKPQKLNFVCGSNDSITNDHLTMLLIRYLTHTVYSMGYMKNKQRAEISQLYQVYCCL